MTISGNLYAIEPQVLADRSNYQLIATGCGVGQGRRIAAFPRRWMAMVDSILRQSGHVAGRRVEVALEMLQQATIRSKAYPKAIDAEKWLSEAETGIQEHLWTAIIAEANPNDHDKVVLPTDLDPFTPPWEVSTQPDWDWLKKLQPECQTWMTQCLTAMAFTPGNFEGICLYFHKVAEKELLENIFVNFRDYERPTLPPIETVEEKLVPLHKYLSGRRSWIALGPMALAIEAAHHNRAGMGQIVRRYLEQTCRDPISCNLLNQDAVIGLHTLADIRDGNTHVESLGQPELDSLVLLMLDGDQPGPFFAGVGVCKD